MSPARAIGDSTRVGLFLATFFGASAVLTAYLPLFLADRGLAAAGIGQVLGLASLLRVAAVPGWGWVADRLRRPRLSLFAAALAATLCAVGLTAGAGVAATAALVVAGGIAAAALTPLTDALTLALAAARRLDYGRTRAWGSVAYMVATASAGALLARTGSWVVPVLLACCYGLATALTAALPKAAALPVHGAASAQRLGAAFGWTVLASALIQGSHAAYYAFAALHWRAAGIADTTIGLLIAVGIVAEIGLFLWGRGLVERLGPARLTAIAAASCALRWSVTALTASVPVLLLVQPLHAATFACQHLSAMLVLRALPPGWAGVAQTLLAALGFSAPTGVLIWLSGLVYGRVGGLVFLLMAAIGGSALLVVPLLPGPAAGRARPPAAPRR